MKSSNSIAIRLSGVSKRYTIHHEKPTLVEKLVKRDETPGFTKKHAKQVFWALKDINLTIKKGERVGRKDIDKSIHVCHY